MTPATAYRTAPGGRTLREWEPSQGLWMNRLWALLSVETWFQNHIRRGTGTPWGLASLAREAVETGQQVHTLLDELAMADDEAILSPDFIVYRDGPDFGFVPLTRGEGNPRRLSEVVAGIEDDARRKNVDIRAANL